MPFKSVIPSFAVASSSSNAPKKRPLFMELQAKYHPRPARPCQREEKLNVKAQSDGQSPFTSVAPWTRTCRPSKSRASTASGTPTPCTLTRQAHKTTPQTSHEEEAGTPQKHEWWLSRCLRLEPQQLNGWVVSQMLDEYQRERYYADACVMLTFESRAQAAGVLGLLSEARAPRKRCADLPPPPTVPRTC